MHERSRTNIGVQMPHGVRLLRVRIGVAKVRKRTATHTHTHTQKKYAAVSDKPARKRPDTQKPRQPGDANSDFLLELLQPSEDKPQARFRDEPCVHKQRHGRGGSL